MSQETPNTGARAEAGQETTKAAGKEGAPKSAKQADLFDQFFNVWEKRTSEYFEKLLRNPAFLNTMGGIMNSGYRNKIYVDKALSAVWRNLNLPNKQDQERTLHLLNELHSRIYDLEEKIATLSDENDRLRASQEGSSAETGKRSRKQSAADLKTAGAE